MSRLPSFFLAGAPKAGTTSLYGYLAQHPQIYMSPIKEPNFFAVEIRAENFDRDSRRSLRRQEAELVEFLSGPMREKRFGGIIANWEDYLRLFANACDETALGEASVCYLWSPTAPARIAGKIPGAKILVMLRNPADRAFSQYLHGVTNGAIRWSFREHIQRNLRYSSGVFSVDYPFLEFGLYSDQVIRYRERFGANVWIGFYEDFADRPAATLESICRFLEVSPEWTADMSGRQMEAQVPRTAAARWLKRVGLWQAAAKAVPRRGRPLFRRALLYPPGRIQMKSEDRDYLAGFYREDIRRLASLLDRDLSHWIPSNRVSRHTDGRRGWSQCPRSF